jgi:hypothetical protein
MTWFAQHMELTPRRELIDIAKAAFAENLQIQKRRLAARRRRADGYSRRRSSSLSRGTGSV